MRLPIQLKVRNRIVETEALIDSGAEGVFIDKKLVEDNWIKSQKLGYEITARNVDGTVNKNGTITKTATLDMRIGTKEYPETFFITSLGTNKIILGLPWLERHNPEIDWRRRLVQLHERQEAAVQQVEKEAAIRAMDTTLKGQSAMAFARQEAQKH